MREWILGAEAASNLNPGDKWRFYLTAGTLCPRIGRDSEQTTSSEYLRARVVIAAVNGDRTLAQLAEQFDVHTPIRSHRGKRSSRVASDVEYEEVYLRAYEGVSDARASIGRSLDFYNGRRPHSSLDGMTPDQAYFTPLPYDAEILLYNLWQLYNPYNLLGGYPVATQPTQLSEPPVIDPDLVPETWVTGRINVNVTGPVATITFTHVRPDPADIFANKKPAAAVSVVRARIVMPVEGLAGLRNLLNQIIFDTAPSSSTAH
jgi:putative transposase